MHIFAPAPEVSRGSSPSEGAEPSSVFANPDLQDRAGFASYE